jgi:16S rRNA (adenine1518-N6/adenine1519-N6)-dimethyltransferase
MIELLEKRKQTDWKDAREIISILHQDVLKYRDVERSYSVIANIPYYITSPILFHFLYNMPISPDEMAIMMQKEVGEKIISSK